MNRLFNSPSLRLIALPTASLRGAQHRGNPAQRTGFSGLLRFARNDGISGPFASGGQGKQPCTHVTFATTVLTTPSLRGAQHRGNPARRMSFSGLLRFTRNDGVLKLVVSIATAIHRVDTTPTTPSLRGVQRRGNPARRMVFAGLPRFARNDGMFEVVL